MAEDGIWCGFKRKTVVMTCIALCCLALVAWTVIVTAYVSPADPTKNDTTAASTTTSSSAPNNSTATTTIFPAPCTFNSSLPIENVKMVIQKDGDYNITRRNFVAKSEGKTKTLCKCFCRIGVTEDELWEAVRLIKLSNNMTGPVMPSPTASASVGVPLN